MCYNPHISNISILVSPLKFNTTFSFKNTIFVYECQICKNVTSLKCYLCLRFFFVRLRPHFCQVRHAKLPLWGHIVDNKESKLQNCKK